MTQRSTVHPLGRKAKASRVSLAAYLNEAMSEEEIFRWLRTVAAGHDPDLARNEDGTPRGPENPPDWTTRRAAMAMILDRRNGRAPQHVTLAAELRASIGVAAVSVDAAQLAQLPDDKKAQLRTLLREIVTGAKMQQAAIEAREQTTQYLLDAARSAGSDEDEEDDE